MTTKTNSTKVIHHKFVGDSKGMGNINAAHRSSFHALDAANRSTTGLTGVQPSTTGLRGAPSGNGAGRSNSNGAQRPAKSSTAQGFKITPNGAAGNRAAAGLSAEQIEKIKKDAFEQGVRAYETGRVRGAQEEQKKVLEGFLKDYMDAKPLDADGVRDALIGASAVEQSAPQRPTPKQAQDARGNAWDGWVRERIDSRPKDDAGMRALIGG